ncbi:TetR/AcrR family transcriptional regulator [Nocardia panacis]|uniref:TetR/AcrR family transcriptional regulator n=1 Tax=Nocardia panacis TaxID=2340916 RepID=A0A3A4KCN1_9NOCA|nr:TetR/AcrR family transcriptional regulator [Nocardia panacis]RJO78028.1 TetR/AcrR family transcriptional regulator [Nocardia panacis]
MVFRTVSDGVVAGSGTKNAIRDAAVKLFANKGFEQTSLREVADAVGITKASLYYHYASKLDLLVAIIDPIIDHLRSTVDGLDRVARDATAIRAVLGRHLRGMLAHRAAGALIIGDTVTIVNAMADRHPELVDSSKALRDWLAGPNPDTEAMLRAGAALDVLGLALVSAEVVPDAGDDEVERILLDIAVSVLEGRRSA